MNRSENQQFAGAKTCARGWLICILATLVHAAAFGQATTIPAIPPAASTAKPAVQSRPAGNRFLIIVDTSAAMKRHATDVSQTINKILHSSASGQLHTGDTLGIWTFNESLYTGNLPLQVWATEDIDEISLRTGQFLREQRYEKKSSLDVALDGMAEVVKRSYIITIFIISDGSGAMRGTPFDEIINANYQRLVREMKGDPRPVVTVLQGKDGKVVTFTVNALPWPIVIPEVPIDLKPARPAATVAAPVSPPVAPPVAQPALTQTNVPPPAVIPASTPAPTPASTPAVAVVPVPVPVVVSPSATSTAPAQPQPAPETVAAPAPTSAPVAVPTARTNVAAPAPRTVAPAPTQAAAPGPAANIKPLDILPDPNIRPTTPGPAARPQFGSPNAAPVAPRVATGTNGPATPAIVQKPAPAGSTNAITAPSDTAAKANALLAQVTAFGKSLMADKTRLIYAGIGALALLLFIVVVRRIRSVRKPSRISLISTTMNDQSQ